MSEHSNPFIAFSDAMAQATAKAGAATVMVNARKRMPASGVVFDAHLILTADHTVEREDGIQVQFGDGSEFTARLAGRDPASDLAVLRLDNPAAAVAEIAPQDAQVGQLALALGRPSSGGIEASLGVISAIGGPARTQRGGLLERFLRTDTIPYPGFSGGPLINAAGQVLGINTSGLTPGSAITIPVSVALPIASSLALHGQVRRGYLGVRSQAVELPEASRQALGRTQETGLLLVGVDRDSPAGAAGLMVGDILVGLAGSPVSDPDSLASLLTGEVVGKPTAVEILRGGQPMVMNVTPGERKA
jgi:S1-C subfamily serine protease